MSKRQRKQDPKSALAFQFLVSLPKEMLDRLDAIASETRTARVALVRSAIEAFLAGRNEEKLSVMLSDELHGDLLALRDAMDSAPAQAVIQRSLRQYIDYMVDNNNTIRTRYLQSHERDKRERRKTASTVVQFVTGRSKAT